MDSYEWVISHHPRPGYFVEAGAHDGVGDSQSLRLERAGWDGLCVEPSSAYHGLTRSRECALDSRPLCGKDNQEVTFREVSGNAVELSGILSHFYDHWDRTTRPHTDKILTGLTLATMLRFHDAPAVIGVLFLDTEGSEVEILAAHDFDAYRFLLIQVEHNGVQSRRDELRKLLEAKGYDYESTDGINDRYAIPSRRA